MPENSKFDHVMQVVGNIGIPLIGGVLTSPVMCMLRQIQTTAQIGKSNAKISFMEFKGLRSTLELQSWRFILRMGSVPYVTRYSKENCPQHLNPQTVSILAAATASTVGDMLNPFEGKVMKEQTTSEKALSVKEWFKRYGVYGTAKEFYRGSAAVGLRSACYHFLAFYPIRHSVHQQVNPTGMENTAAKEIFYTAVLAGIISGVGTPTTLHQTLCQGSNPLNYRQATIEIGRRYAEGGIKALYPGCVARTIFTSTAALTAGTILYAQEEWQKYITTTNKEAHNNDVRKVC